MGQSEDRLLDVIGRIRSACISLSTAADDTEWGKREQDLMAAKADGLAMALGFVEDELKDKRPRRAF